MSDPIPPVSATQQHDVLRSEERLDVTTRRMPIGRAVLRKTIVVEQRTITVDVAHEEVTLEHLPFDGSEAEETEEAHAAHLALPDLVLYEEQVVITKRMVPTERVRVEISTVTEDRRITEDLRKERIDVSDGPVSD
jgi:uncharacterized protein (TIGR02271 family)